MAKCEIKKAMKELRQEKFHWYVHQKHGCGIGHRNNMQNLNKPHMDDRLCVRRG